MMHVWRWRVTGSVRSEHGLEKAGRLEAMGEGRTPTREELNCPSVALR